MSFGGDVKHNELVWRTLVDASLNGQRQWDSYSDIGFAAGVPWTTAQLACRKLIDIGAVTKYKAGGLSVVSPEKTLAIACAARNLRVDTLARTTADALSKLSRGQLVFGGVDAAIQHLGGVNTIANFSQRIVYVPDDASAPNDLPSGDEVRVLRMDRRAALDWVDISSAAQTMIDLFATPGWQASEFRLALQERLFAARDWDQKPRPIA